MARDENAPSSRESADLTRRLRALSNAGRDADPAERAAFLADKDVLLARIEAATGRARTAEHEVRPDTGLDREPLGAEYSATGEDDGEEWSR